MELFYLVNILLFTVNGILATNSCRFEYPGYGVIDLASIGLRTGQPTFKDVIASTSSNYAFSFNPCYSFNELDCENSAVCQTSYDRRYSFKLAQQNSSVWSYNASTKIPTLTYNYQAKTVAISMICSSDSRHSLEIIGETRLNYFVMRLHSPCACWNGCEKPMTSSTTPSTTTPSIYSTACMYHDDRYGTIDLSSIGSVNGTATFNDMTTIYTDNFLWSYNPCVPFTEDSCYRVAACQKSKTFGTSYAIGFQELIRWTNMNRTSNLPPSIVYSTWTDQRQLTVQLICDVTVSNHQLQVIGEMSSGQYLMILTSRCACYNGCSSDPDPPGPHHFKWQTWMTISAAAGGIFLCLCSAITCLICSKPKRRYQPLIINERTPIMQSSAKLYPSLKQ